MSHSTAPPPSHGLSRQVLCPYCGEISQDGTRCDHCRGLFEPLSRQASQNTMGPWFVRDPGHAFFPGCSFETLTIFIKRGRITPATVLRGPTTRQFWMFARRVPTVANLLGICHSCQAAVKPEDAECPYCHADFRPDTDRQHLGLADVRLLPGQATPEMIAASTFGTIRPTVPTVARPESPPAITRQTGPAGSQGMLVALVILAVACAGLLAAVTYLILAPSFAPPQGGSPPSQTPSPASGPSQPMPVEAVPIDEPSAEPSPEPPEEHGEVLPAVETPAEDPADNPPPAEPPRGSIQLPRYAALIEDSDVALVRHGLDLLRASADADLDPVARADLERVGGLRLELLGLRRRF